MSRRRLDWNAARRDLQRDRERPEKTPEQKEAWIKRQAENAIAQVKKPRWR